MADLRSTPEADLAVVRATSRRCVVEEMLEKPVTTAGIRDTTVICWPSTRRFGGTPVAA